MARLNRPPAALRGGTEAGTARSVRRSGGARLQIKGCSHGEDCHPSAGRETNRQPRRIARAAGTFQGLPRARAARYSRDAANRAPIKDNKSDLRSRVAAAWHALSESRIIAAG